MNKMGEVLLILENPYVERFCNSSLRFVSALLEKKKRKPSMKRQPTFVISSLKYLWLIDCLRLEYFRSESKFGITVITLIMIIIVIIIMIIIMIMITLRMLISTSKLLRESLNRTIDLFFLLHIYLFILFLFHYYYYYF